MFDTTIDIVGITWIIFVVLLSMFLFMVLHFRLSKRNVNFGKRYTALLIDSQEQIALKIPMNGQKQIPNGSHSTTIHTETLNPYDEADEADEDYYQSVLSLNDLSYFPVHETVYQVYPKAHCSLITDVKQGTVSSATEISFL
ncbi:unnamed protein product [Adineta ricciae]|uniref:Uncharacterized protein n=1 Tax=Adineta ricciae TaxID=249248 RepID=A0A815JS78_ADIRI|nr:unnamed protein product [Adineta ricciae]